MELKNDRDKMSAEIIKMSRTMGEIIYGLQGIVEEMSQKVSKDLQENRGSFDLGHTNIIVKGFWDTAPLVDEGLKQLSQASEMATCFCWRWFQNIF